MQAAHLQLFAGLDGVKLHPSHELESLDRSSLVLRTVGYDEYVQRRHELLHRARVAAGELGRIPRFQELTGSAGKEGNDAEQVVQDAAPKNAETCYDDFAEPYQC